ncbi:AAA family ATPase [Promicromonospora sp. NPDC059942]|uniref:AAA family ATPase n=1 Tax=Promicromonospora sp. NPDC059942 TaxID=3347009 RepID=UPI00365C3660
MVPSAEGPTDGQPEEVEPDEAPAPSTPSAESPAEGATAVGVVAAGERPGQVADESPEGSPAAAVLNGAASDAPDDTPSGAAPDGAGNDAQFRAAPDGAGSAVPLRAGGGDALSDARSSTQPTKIEAQAEVTAQAHVAVAVSATAMVSDGVPSDISSASAHEEKHGDTAVEPAHEGIDASTPAAPSLESLGEAQAQELSEGSAERASVPSSEDMAPPPAEIVTGRPRDEVWGQDKPDPEGKNVAELSQLIESVTRSATADDDEATQVAEVLEIDEMTEVLEPVPDRVEVPSPSEAVADDPDLMEELPSRRPIPADAIKRASEALDAAVNAAPAVIGSATMTFEDEMVDFVDAEFTHFDGETVPEAKPEAGASDYSVRVTDPIPVQSLSAPGVSRETTGSVQTPNGTQQPTGGPHGGDDERRSALIATVPAVDETTPVAAELAMDARRRIELQGRKFPRPPKTRIITVANQKGGVGKTTTTVNIAAGLAQSGLNVLVIDNDPQGNASTALGIEHRAGTPSVYEILVEGEPLANTIQQCPDIPNLWGVPATIDLSGSEIELISLVSRETRLRKALDKYLADRVAAGEERIDYVLIDCPPSLGLLTVNAFVAGREVFIPVQCEYYALEGLSQLLKTIDLIRSHLNPELRVSSILLTMYDGRTNLAQQVAGEVRSHFPAETFKTTIPRSVRISEAPSYGQTVMTYDATSTGALAYLQSSRELAERGQGGSSPRRAMKTESVGAQD